MKLWLLRHAQVELAAGVCYGQSNVPAQPDATRRAAAALARSLPHGAALQVSTLQRCELLAQELCALRPDLILKPDARLRELNFGAWESQPWSAIPRADFDAWLADFAHARPGGDGESVAELMVRVAAAWDEWLARGRDAVWVTHAGVVRAVRLLERGVRVPTAASDWPAEPLAFGAAWVVER